MERCCERRGVGEACVNAYGGGSEEPYEDVHHFGNITIRGM
jgi:hypothetical protein